MSTLRIITLLIFLFSFGTLFSQANQNEYAENIVVNLNNNVINSFSINKDSTLMSLSLYIKGYESKKKREQAMILFRKKYNKAVFISPSFTMDIISLEKPEKLKSLDNIKYLFASNFSKSDLKTSNPFFIIIKQKDGTYLKWKSSVLAVE
jgi:hypothetical protein